MSNKKHSDKKRMGRPPKPAGEVLSEQINVRVTRAERRLLEKQAREQRTTISRLLMQPWREED